jgi:C4-dicarboxylate-binding protein DctP
MLAPSLAKFGPLGVKEFEVFDLPYIFPNKTRCTASPKARSARPAEEARTQGHHRPGILGQRLQGHVGQQAAAPPADFKGMKMRIQSSKVLDAQMRALGANPQVMAFSEVYQALQTGVVDGTENPPSNIYTQKMHEVQKHVTVSNHGYLGYAVIVNKKFWDGLPADLRTALEGAMKDATTYEKPSPSSENDLALEAIKASGKTEVYSLNAAAGARSKAGTGARPLCCRCSGRKWMESRIGKEYAN